jgi:hypothetical protein
MKFEVFAVISVLYQVALFFLIRRLVKARESYVQSLVDSWKESSKDYPYPAVLKHGGWRKKVILAAAAYFIVFIQATFLGVGSSLESSSWSWIAFGLGLNLGFAWVPWALVAEEYGMLILFDDEKITRLSPWSKELTVRWWDIESVTYWSFWHWFTIKTNEGTIRVNTILENLGSFARLMVESVPRAKLRVSEGTLTKAVNGPFRF